MHRHTFVKKENSNKSAKILTAYNGTLTDGYWRGVRVPDNTMSKVVF